MGTNAKSRVYCPQREAVQVISASCFTATGFVDRYQSTSWFWKRLRETDQKAYMAHTWMGILLITGYPIWLGLRPRKTCGKEANTAGHDMALPIIHAS